MIVTVTKENFVTEIETYTKPVVIEVSASWCGPCQQMKPIFEQAARDMGDACKFAAVNVDSSREIAIKYRVTSIPTFVFINNGVVLGSEHGYMPLDDLKAKVKQYFAL